MNSSICYSTVVFSSAFVGQFPCLWPLLTYNAREEGKEADREGRRE